MRGAQDRALVSKLAAGEAEAEAARLKFLASQEEDEKKRAALLEEARLAEEKAKKYRAQQHAAEVIQAVLKGALTRNLVKRKLLQEELREEKRELHRLEKNSLAMAMSEEKKRLIVAYRERSACVLQGLVRGHLG